MLAVARSSSGHHFLLLRHIQCWLWHVPVLVITFFCYDIFNAGCGTFQFWSSLSFAMTYSMLVVARSSSGHHFLLLWHIQCWLWHVPVLVITFFCYDIFNAGCGTFQFSSLSFAMTYSMLVVARSSSLHFLLLWHIQCWLWHVPVLVITFFCYDIFNAGCGTFQFSSLSFAMTYSMLVVARSSSGHHFLLLWHIQCWLWHVPVLVITFFCYDILER